MPTIVYPTHPHPPHTHTCEKHNVPHFDPRGPTLQAGDTDNNQLQAVITNVKY